MNRALHADIFQQERKQRQTVFLVPEQFAPDHLDLFRAKFVARPCLVCIPGSTFTLYVLVGLIHIVVFLLDLKR